MDRQIGTCIVLTSPTVLQHVAERFAGFPRQLIPPIHLARGCYMKLQGASASVSRISSTLYHIDTLSYGYCQCLDVSHCVMLS